MDRIKAFLWNTFLLKPKWAWNTLDDICFFMVVAGLFLLFGILTLKLINAIEDGYDDEL